MLLIPPHIHIQEAVNHKWLVQLKFTNLCNTISVVLYWIDIGHVYGFDYVALVIIMMGMVNLILIVSSISNDG